MLDLIHLPKRLLQFSQIRSLPRTHIKFSSGFSRVGAGMWCPMLYLEIRFLYLVPVAPTLNATPEGGSNPRGFDVIFQVGNQKLNGSQLYIGSLTFGLERKAHTLTYVHGFKQLSRQKEGKYRAAGQSDKDIGKIIAHVNHENEPWLRNLGFWRK